MEFRPVLYALGIIMLVLAGLMIFPAMVDLYNHHEDWKVFVFSSLFTCFIGGFLVLNNAGFSFSLGIREAFLLTILTWVMVGLFAAIPLMYSSMDMSFTDAVFESVSGVTTTGSTVITSLDTAPYGVLLWRSLLQWIGGLGVILLALSILPMLGIGGMQLFRAEAFESEKILPRASQLAAGLASVYIIGTVAGTILLMVVGMNTFDALNHGMAAIATGGFSTKDSSVAYFDSIAIDYVITLLMIVGAIPFVLYIKVAKGDWRSFWRDSQVRWFIFILGGAIAIMTANLVINGFYNFADALQYAAFNVTSLMTGTGFATHDFDLWGPFAFAFMFFLMCVGGCAGSTSCGIKIFRWQILYEMTRIEIMKLLHPHGVFVPRYNGRPMPEGVAASVMSFFFLFALSFSVVAIALHWTGLDFMTAMSSAASAISNVGPGLGPIVGPSGNFSTLTDAGKWIMAFAMLLGRLELFTLFVLLSKHFWVR